MEAFCEVNGLNNLNPNPNCRISDIDMSQIRQIRKKTVINLKSLDINAKDPPTKKLSDNLKVKKRLSTPTTTLLENDEKYLKKSENMKNVRHLKRFLKINDTTAAILGIMGLLFAVIEYETFYDDTNKERYTSTDSCVMLRSFVSITTAVVIGLLIIHSILAYQLSLRQDKKAFDELKLNYFSSNHFKQLILEIIIIGIHCPPKLDQVFEVHQLGIRVDYSIDGILMVWMLLRFYLVFRLFAQYSKWTNELAEQCCEPEGCEANTSFAMKAVLKEKPFTSLLCLMMISAIIFGLAVRHFERPYYYNYSPKAPGFQDYSYIWNGMWLIMITMMTGYLNSL